MTFIISVEKMDKETDGEKWLVRIIKDDLEEERRYYFDLNEIFKLDIIKELILTNLK